jgi:hypothetical protein
LAKKFTPLEDLCPSNGVNLIYQPFLIYLLDIH